MTKPGNDFAAELDRCGLSQRAFIRLVELLGNGEKAPTVSTVNRWATYRLDTPGYAFAILNLYELLPDRERARINEQIVR